MMNSSSTAGITISDRHHDKNKDESISSHKDTDTIVQPQATNGSVTDQSFHTTPANEFSLTLQSHALLSQTENSNFSQEIVEALDRKDDVENIRNLLSTKFEDALQQGVVLLRDIHTKYERFIACSAKHSTLILFLIGTILNLIEDFIREKHESKAMYIQWVRNNFMHNHTRRFQQAKQIARMGEFARKYASVGKNRLLEIYRIQRYFHEIDQELSLDQIVEKYPIPDLDKDSIHDEKGYLTTVFIDAVITKERLGQYGLKDVTFEQARLIAMYRKQALDIKGVKRLKKHTDKSKSKKETLERYVMNHCYIASTNSGSKDSMESFLQRFIARCDDFGLNELLIKKRSPKKH